MRDYYVYIHRKATNGEVFYVGKGYGRRAYRVTSRSKFWTRIYKKYGLIVEIVQSGLQEWYAHELEQNLIAYYGRIDSGYGTLCNLSDGGEGNSGMIRSEEFKKKLSLERSGKQPHQNTISGRSKPVIRSDGKIFDSAASAARHMRDEGWAKAAHFGILAVANKKPHAKTLYGYSWEFWKG